MRIIFGDKLEKKKIRQSNFFVCKIRKGKNFKVHLNIITYTNNEGKTLCSIILMMITLCIKNRFLIVQFKWKFFLESCLYQTDPINRRKREKVRKRVKSIQGKRLL